MSLAFTHIYLLLVILFGVFSKLPGNVRMCGRAVKWGWGTAAPVDGECQKLGAHMQRTIIMTGPADLINKIATQKLTIVK